MCFAWFRTRRNVLCGLNVVTTRMKTKITRRGQRNEMKERNEALGLKIVSSFAFSHQLSVMKKLKIFHRFHLVVKIISISTFVHEFFFFSFLSTCFSQLISLVKNHFSFKFSRKIHLFGIFHFLRVCLI